MKPKIVFISSSSFNSPFKIKRVDEFIAHDYEVESFCFTRSDDPNRTEPNFAYHVMGNLLIGDSYLKRVPIMYKAIRRVVRQYRGFKDVIFYTFGLDVAMMVRQCCGSTPFIFEEADMVHTYITLLPMRNYLERQVQKTISKSFETVFTSEGFMQYHCGDNVPDNVSVIPNRLDASVLRVARSEKKPLDINHLSIGFTGVVRFHSIVNFAEHLCKNYPQHEFHFFGFFDEEYSDVEAKMGVYSNCTFHGKFKTPIDLPNIYSQIDLLLSTYDVVSLNVKYAEPNKLYESVYFNTPIIVSSGTFLAAKVNRLGIGFDIDAMNTDSIDSLLLGLTEQKLLEKINKMKSLSADFAINRNDTFFEKIERRLA